MKELCEYLAGLFLVAGIVFFAVLATQYIGYGVTDRLARMGIVELCLFTASLISYLGVRYTELS